MLKKITPNGKLAVATTLTMIFGCVISIKLYSDKQYRYALEKEILKILKEPTC